MTACIKFAHFLFYFLGLDYRSACNECQNSCIRENEFIMRENDFVSDDLSSIQSASLTNSFSGEHSDFERLCGPYVDMRELDPQGDAALSDVSSQPELLYNPSREECWIVSPSPCFIGQDVSLEKLKSSSMEDLLIEHPSMSIYKSRGQRPLRNAMNESQRFLSDEHKNSEVCSSIRRNCESLENLDFLLPQEHVSVVRNDRLEQSAYWTSDSESSSPDLSVSRLRSGGDQSLGVVINSERQNLEDEQLMNESSDSLNSGRDNLHRKCHSRMQMRSSHGNVERNNNKALQQQSRKKRRYRRMCYSSFNSPISKKKGS